MLGEKGGREGELILYDFVGGGVDWRGIQGLLCTLYFVVVAFLIHTTESRQSYKLEEKVCEIASTTEQSVESVEQPLKAKDMYCEILF